MRGMLIMKMLARLTMASVLVLFSSSLLLSQIYKWRDKDGNLVISTTPPPPGTNSESRGIEGCTVSHPKPNGSNASGKPAPQVELKRSCKDIKVIMYMTEWCPVCRKARAYLKSLGLNFTEYDVDKNPEKEEEWIRINPRKSVPVFDIEGKKMVGFSEQEIKAALEERSRLAYRY